METKEPLKKLRGWLPKEPKLPLIAVGSGFRPRQTIGNTEVTVRRSLLPFSEGMLMLVAISGILALTYLLQISPTHRIEWSIAGAVAGFLLGLPTLKVLSRLAKTGHASTLSSDVPIIAFLVTIIITALLSGPKIVPTTQFQYGLLLFGEVGFVAFYLTAAVIFLGWQYKYKSQIWYRGWFQLFSLPKLSGDLQI